MKKKNQSVNMPTKKVRAWRVWMIFSFVEECGVGIVACSADLCFFSPSRKTSRKIKNMKGKMTA